MAEDDRLLRAFDSLQPLARKLGLGIDDVRFEAQERADVLIDQLGKSAPHVRAAVFEFVFEVGPQGAGPLLKRIPGFLTQGHVLMRQTVNLDWLPYYFAMYGLLARDSDASLDTCRIVDDPANEPFPPKTEKSTHLPPAGVPYSGNPADVDEWSAAVFARLQTWPVAMGGAWTRWPPGYLVLTVKEFDGRSIDPIVLDTDNDELTVTFGYWECHLDGPDYLGALDNVALSSAEAIRLIEDWLTERLCTAVYYSTDEKWCGTITVNPDQLPEQLAGGFELLSTSGPTLIELRRPERAHWQFFRILPDGNINETMSLRP